MNAGFLVATVILILMILKLLLPVAIRYLVEVVPLDKTVKVFHVNPTLSKTGFQIDLKLSVDGTRVPLPFVWVTLKIPVIRVVDLENMNLLATVQMPNELCIDWNSDLVIDDVLAIELGDLKNIKQLVKRLLIGGQNELQRHNLRLQFTLDMNFMGFTIDNVDCGKTLVLKELMANSNAGTSLQKVKAELVTNQQQSMLASMFIESGVLPRASKTNENSESISEFRVNVAKTATTLDIPQILVYTPPSIHSMVPDVCVSTSITAYLQSLDIIIDLKFEDFPNVILDWPAMSFSTCINDSVVSRVVVDAFSFNHDTTHIQVGNDGKPKYCYKLRIIVEPTAVNTVYGGIDTSMGLLKGCIRGVLNGCLYGDWGKDLGLFRMCDFRLCKSKTNSTENIEAKWVEELLSLVDVEFDFDAVGGLQGYVGVIGKRVAEHYECCLQ